MIKFIQWFRNTILFYSMAGIVANELWQIKHLYGIIMFIIIAIISIFDNFIED